MELLECCPEWPHPTGRVWWCGGEQRLWQEPARAGGGREFPRWGIPEGVHVPARMIQERVSAVMPEGGALIPGAKFWRGRGWGGRAQTGVGRVVAGSGRACPMVLVFSLKTGEEELGTVVEVSAIGRAEMQT